MAAHIDGAGDMTITPDRLREVVYYDPDSGSFTWHFTHGPARAGAAAALPNKGDRYKRICIDGRRYKAHRLAWMYVYGVWPAGFIDHINGDGLDNRIANLRDVNPKENIHNERRARANNKSSDLIGAWRTSNNPNIWTTKVVLRGKPHYVGNFASAEAAHAAYVELKRKLHALCTI
jgi:hypothetical protein